MARPAKRLQQLGKGLMLAAPYGAALLLVLGLRVSGIAETLNLLLYDLVTHLRPAPAGATTPITLIGISEQDISLYGWPIDDRLLCDAIRQLSEEGAGAIGFDLYRDKGVGPRQECLRQQARSRPTLAELQSLHAMEAAPCTAPAEQCLAPRQQTHSRSAPAESR